MSSQPKLGPDGKVEHLQEHVALDLQQKQEASKAKLKARQKKYENKKIAAMRLVPGSGRCQHGYLGGLPGQPGWS